MWIWAIAPLMVSSKSAVWQLPKLLVRIDIKWLLKLKTMCKEGAYWGTVAGVYLGVEYGVEKLRGARDWKSAVVAGAFAGAIVSAPTTNNVDTVLMHAIIGAALASATNFFTHIK